MTRLVRVTEALGPYADFSMVDDDVLQKAAQRGTDTHRYCQMIADGLWVNNIKTECQGPVQSFKRWFDSMVDEVIATEVELKDEALGFMGHIDLIARLRDTFTYVIDYKTPITKGKLWEAQLAGYEHLAKRKYQIKQSGSLQLHPDGGVPKMNWYTDNKEAFTAFLSAVNAYRHFKL